MNIRRLLTAVIGLVLVATSTPSADEAAVPTLQVIAGGINTRGTSMLSGVMPQAAGAKVFRIGLDASTGDDRSISHWVRNYVQHELLDSAADPSGTTAINVRDANDPRLRAILDEIAGTPNAVVHLDMDLVGVPGGPAVWQDQSTKLAALAARVAEERLKVQPTSRNSIYAHSAGTMGLSRLLQANKGDLYQQKVAASPMTWKLAKDVVVVLAEGDLPSTEEGYRPGGVSLAARDRDGWLKEGNTVVQVSGRGLDVQPSDLASTFLKMLPPVYKHVQASALGVLDQKVTVSRTYQHPSAPGEPPSPERIDTFEVQNVSSGQILRALGEAGGRSVPSAALKERIMTLEPPKGGGIALKAAAEFPFGRSEVVGAAWDDRSDLIVIQEKDGRAWRLPPMDAELAATAFECLFGERPMSPEFSIGAPLDETREQAAEDTSPTYFLPERVLRSSKLGFLMHQADLALGDIAFGGTAKLVSRKLTELSGYHSLPEMFSKKYSRGAGGSSRIVIQSLPAKLNAEGNVLTFERRNEFAVRFGRTTPVERAYADLFAVHQQAIIDRVPELQHLLAASRVVGVLQWLRENDVPFDPGELRQMATGRYETPAHVTFDPLPLKSEIRERLPLVVYNEHGPVSIRGANGERTEITYLNQHVRKIVRADGKTLEVLSDDLNQPLAIEISGEGAAAFTRLADGYALFHDDVVLHRGGAGLRIERKAQSGASPERNSRELINTIAAGFVSFADRRQPTPPPVGEPPQPVQKSQPPSKLSRTTSAAAGAFIVVLLAAVFGWRMRQGARVLGRAR